MLCGRAARLAISSLALLAASAPAFAQNGAVWMDDKGRPTTLQFAGGSGAPPPAMARSPEDMSALFKQLCLDTQSNPANAAVAGLTAAPQTIPGGKSSPELVLNVWRGDGLVVSQTDGFFVAPNAQCTAVFYVTALPASGDMAKALEATLGRPPANADKAVKKNGKPNDSWSPEWEIPVRGAAWLLTVHVIADSRYTPGDQVQIAIRSQTKGG
jgi:hypothetical protein